MKNGEQLSTEHQNSMDNPIVELRLKKWTYVLGCLAILWSMWFLSFGTIVPYLTTGNFAEIWPAHHGSTSMKATFFIFSWYFWLYCPQLVQQFRLGNIYFYGTYVEVRPHLWLFNKRTIAYDVLHVKQRGNRAMVLTNGKTPNIKTNIFRYWKAMDCEGIIVPMNSMLLHNPECLPKALEIIRDRSISISSY